MIAPGAVLTFPKEREVKVVKVLACGERRGPAPEAQSLYEDLSPKPEPVQNEQAPNPRFEGRGPGPQRRTAGRMVLIAIGRTIESGMRLE